MLKRRAAQGGRGRRAALLGAALGSIVGAAGPALAEEETVPRLYQLLYDQQFTAPLDTLGQQVRIWIWLEYMGFDESQLRRLQRLGERFQTRVAEMNTQMDQLIAQYEAGLVPRYEEIYTLLKRGDATEAELEAAAERLAVSALSSQRDEALRELRVATLRAILNDEKEFLYTLSPEQEQKFVTSLYFLRHTIDPFAAPATYREIIGPTWNAGDFTSLLRKKEGDAHLNIGGLWGIQPGAADNPNYAHIKRSMVLFYVLKEPMLAPTIAEMLEVRAGARPGSPVRSPQVVEGPAPP